MSKLSKFLTFLFVLFSLFTIHYSLFTAPAGAQVPGLRFPCDKTDSPEFHSLRPYQAAFCGDAGKALYCSNDLKFLETFDVTNKGECVRQYADGTNIFFCNPDFPVDPHTLIVTLDDSMFPIMGNTEEVKNSDPNSSEVFDDATKVNEYASWYLSGVNNRAEYGENTDEKVVNFSGPVQKLLPKMIQEANRIETIKKGTLTTHWVDSLNGDTYDTPQNHDQIVVCANGNDAKPCPEGSELRLSDWGEGSLSAINTFFNWLGTDIWNHKYPPLPWQFDEQIMYRKAYSEWQGKNCAILPIVGLQCLDTPVPNKWSDLYQYIPLSNTTDKKGANMIFDVQPRGTGGTEIDGFDYGDVRNAPLYFAHTQEVKESAELLNKTFTPLDCPVDEEGNRIPDEECKLLENKRGNIEANNCSVANIRVNKGDNLFPGDPDELQVPDITYKIIQAKCKEVWDPDRPCPGHPQDICPKSSFECTAQVYITIKTKTKTPNANEIFDETVAGTGSTFRKIFPKVGEGAPVSCIADMPTVTDVTYDPMSLSQPPPGGELEYVGTIRFPEDGAGDSPQLTFPHVGSVYEYFLKGIQTALRPKGYGEPIANGVLCSNLDGGDCSWDMNRINQGIKTAAAKYQVPESLLRSIFEIESYEWVNGAEEYVCEPRSDSGAMGVAQITQETYEAVTASCGQNMEDKGMCDSYDPKLSRCNFGDSFELMARILLLKAGRWNSSNCSAYSGIDESEKMVWYNAACNYYGSHDPDDLTRGLQNDIPPSSRRPSGDMNYCDIVCQKMGQCPEYP